MDNLAIFGLQFFLSRHCVRRHCEVVRDTMVNRETDPPGIDPAGLPLCVSAHRD